MKFNFLLDLPLPFLGLPLCLFLLVFDVDLHDSFKFNFGVIEIWGDDDDIICFLSFRPDLNANRGKGR